ncbi:MAG: hypothetical protein ACJAXA_000308, partial [Candidatus Aldehydirespiratoraceae bacterium]
GHPANGVHRVAPRIGSEQSKSGQRIVETAAITIVELTRLGSEVSNLIKRKQIRAGASSSSDTDARLSAKKEADKLLGQCPIVRIGGPNRCVRIDIHVLTQTGHRPSDRYARQRRGLVHPPPLIVSSITAPVDDRQRRCDQGSRSAQRVGCTSRTPIGSSRHQLG